MTEQFVTYRGTVYPHQCDHMGHMNVMWYAGKFDEATRQLLSAIGLTPSRMRRDGLVLAAAEGHIACRRELRAGDVITVRSEIMEVRDQSVRIAHQMSNDDTGEVVASMIVVGMYVERLASPSAPGSADAVGRCRGAGSSQPPADRPRERRCRCRNSVGNQPQGDSVPSIEADTCAPLFAQPTGPRSVSRHSPWSSSQRWRWGSAQPPRCSP